MEDRLTRRDLLRSGGAAGALLAGASMLGGTHGIAHALAGTPPAHGRLHDIDHVVILIQENRSFDHYFGSYRGVRGFADPAGASVFAQPGWNAPGYGGRLRPFRLDTARSGECTDDINHSWAPQHAYWDGGALDGFVRGHLAADTAAAAPLTMGYYTRADLDYYYALADAFTICDGYHCSVLGPTDPNRLYAMSATLDPDGTAGGPILSTSSTRLERLGGLTWTTMPEQLSAHGVSWRVYSDATGNFGDNVLSYFRGIVSNPKLAARAFGGTLERFTADARAGHLPQVSWVLAPLLNSEHPPLPVAEGELFTRRVIDALTANGRAWGRTALFITFDENGGFFDHVPPPVAPPGTPGEHLTGTLPPDAGGVAGPIGLGFRVPLLVVSPFSRGGFVCSDTFDHTSTLRFLETRFGVEVPNLSSWRRSVTGDLTSAFNFRAPDGSVPALPPPTPPDPFRTSDGCFARLAGEVSPALESLLGAQPYPVPAPPQAQPGQEPGAARRPSGLI